MAWFYTSNRLHHRLTPSFAHTFAHSFVWPTFVLWTWKWCLAISSRLRHFLLFIRRVRVDSKESYALRMSSLPSNSHRFQVDVQYLRFGNVINGNFKYSPNKWFRFSFLGQLKLSLKFHSILLYDYMIIITSFCGIGFSSSFFDPLRPDKPIIWKLELFMNELILWIDFY